MVALDPAKLTMKVSNYRVLRQRNSHRGPRTDAAGIKWGRVQGSLVTVRAAADKSEPSGKDRDQLCPVGHIQCTFILEAEPCPELV